MAAKTIKTIGGGTLTSTPVPSSSWTDYWNARTETEVRNYNTMAAIKVDGSVVAWGQNSYVPSDLDGTIDAVQLYSNGTDFAALRADGSLTLMGYQKVTADTFKKLDGTIDVKSVSSNWGAFAATLDDGSVVTWGEASIGGDSKIHLNDGTTQSVVKDLNGTIDVKKVFSIDNGFAALRVDGSVVVWGNNYNWNSDIAKQLDGTIDVVNIYQLNWGAYGALRADGSLITWGYSWGAGDSSSVASQLDGTIDVINVYSNGNAAAALRTDGSVVTWGDSNSGGDSSSVASQLDGTVDVKQIYTTNWGGFAALRTDGSLIAWGYGNTTNSWWGNNGIEFSSVASQLDGTVAVTKVFSNGSSSAALRADGSVVTWGYKDQGGDSSSVASQIDGTIDVTEIYNSNSGGFDALRADGSIVHWGQDYSWSGFTSFSSVATQLDGTVDVVKVYSNSNANAALRADGSVITWGYSWSGGDSSSVASQLDGTIDVVDIYNNGNAFAALRTDGSVVTWGDSWSGGNSSSAKADLASGVEVFPNIYTDDFYTAPDGKLPEKKPNEKPTGTLTIEGKTEEGEILKVSNKIGDADGLGKMHYQWLSDGAAIIGASQSTYSLSQIDAGKKISVAAFYTDGLDTNENVISPAVDVVNKNDVPTGSVVISGTVAKGQKLVVSNTLEDADGLGEISYQWLRDGKPIKQANGTDYILVVADLNKKISVQASYTDQQNTSESVTSIETNPVAAPINHVPTGTVIMTGELRQKQTLTVTNNLVDVDGMGDVAYQWFSNGLPIEEANQDKITLTQKEVRKTLSVTASYTDGLGKLEQVSAGVVFDENDAPEGGVSINGDVQVGNILTVLNNISDLDEMNGDFQYQWQADGEIFAEGNSVTLSRDEVGKVIKVVAQYTDNGGTIENVPSTETEQVTPLNALPEGYIIIMGEAKVGTELGVLSTLKDIDGIGEFQYQWYSSDTPIRNATERSYTLALGDVGERISVEISYVDGYGTLESVTSAGTAVVQANNVTGLIQEGSDNGKITGTDKNDVLSALPKINYTISALAGNDVLSGDSGNDTLDAGRGDDKIIGGLGNDKIIGGDGNDTLKGGLGADTMQGGDGDDYYFVDDPKDLVVEANKNGRLGGNDTIEVIYSYTLDKNIENLVLAGQKNTFGTGNEFANLIVGNFADNVLNGEAGNDDLSGSNGADKLFGGDGEDVLDGGQDDDFISGDSGDDYLQGGEGSDILDGGDGEDVAIFNGVQTDYQITKNTDENQNAQIIIKYIGNGVDEGVDVLTNIEMLKFGEDEAIGVADVQSSALNNTSLGTNEADTLVGGAADDGIDGKAGDDLINGDAGDDTINGGVGNDTISGDAGKDVINGGKGVDLLTGGLDADVFKFSAGDNGDLPSKTILDTILDFESKIDVIDFVSALTRVNKVTANEVGVAGISNSTSIATFNIKDKTFDQHLTAVEAGLTKSSAAANKGIEPVANNFALWKEGTDSYLFVTDGYAGITPDDVLVKLTGIALSTTNTLASGNITAL